MRVYSLVLYLLEISLWTLILFKLSVSAYSVSGLHRLLLACLITPRKYEHRISYVLVKNLGLLPETESVRKGKGMVTMLCTL